MTLSFEDAQQKWAFDQFKYSPEKDHPAEGDTFAIESTIIYGGFCDTCAYSTAGFEVTNTRTRACVEVEVSFSEMVASIGKYSDAAQ